MKTSTIGSGKKMESQISKTEGANLPPTQPEFRFDMNLICFADLKMIYAHFNLMTEDSVTTCKELFDTMEPEDNEFVERMSYVAALISHNCIKTDAVRIKRRKREMLYPVTLFNTTINFTLDFIEDYEKYCEEGIGLECMIDEFGLEILAPIFAKYSFVKHTPDH